MPRQGVSSTEVQSFRDRITAYNHRQTMELHEAVSRKRTSSHTESENKRPFLQRTDNYQATFESQQFKRPVTLQAQRNNVSLDQISNLALPSPAVSDYDQYFNASNIPMTQSRGPSTTLNFDDIPSIHDFEPSHDFDLETPADQLDGFDFDCDTDSEKGWSEPSTPDGPTFGLQAPEGGLKGFIDLSFLSEHERNLVVAMASRQKEGADVLPAATDYAYAAHLEVSQPSAADFEAAFMELMNVT